MSETKSIEPFGTFPASGLQSLVQKIGRRLPNNWGGRRFSGWLRFLLQTTATAPIDVIELGSKMRLHLGDNACERRLMVTPQFFEPKDLAAIERMISPDFHFVDLGANVGTYSLFVAHRTGPGAKILAIEPQPRMLSRLRENIALNDFDVTVAPVAVLDRAGSIELTVDENNYGNTSVHPGRKHRGGQSLVTVPAKTLLELVESAGMERIDALKVDVEGAEDVAILPFFDNASETLWPKLILVEHNDEHWTRDLPGELIELGYRNINRATRNLAFVREATG